jgi:hypothetical protein
MDFKDAVPVRCLDAVMLDGLRQEAHDYGNSLPHFDWLSANGLGKRRSW